ncbi:ABC transporter ATP-binding protein [bacterium]|nr:ABC transporter ATP-binding protein [bacterium]
MNDSIIIQTSNLTRSFGDLTAVSNLNLEISRGEIFGLVGPDGAGKTTTLRMLCGLIDPSEGQARVAGFDVTEETESLKDRIGYMAQRFGLYGDLTVEENIFFYADLFGISHSGIGKSMAALLKMTRMEPFQKRQASKLSGGMKQKLALMCTLLHRPQILFLDEPTNGVDPLSRRDFWAILYQLVKEGMTVFVTTSYMDEAERCSRVGLLYKGRLIRCDSPSAIKNDFKEVCYEIKCSDQRKVKDGLYEFEGVISVELSGSSLHLFISPDLISIAEIEHTLNERGLGPVTSKKIKPSLEDVFIATIHKEQRIRSDKR